MYPNCADCLDHGTHVSAHRSGHMYPNTKYVFISYSLALHNIAITTDRVGFQHTTGRICLASDVAHLNVAANVIKTMFSSIAAQWRSRKTRKQNWIFSGQCISKLWKKSPFYGAENGFINFFLVFLWLCIALNILARLGEKVEAHIHTRVRVIQPNRYKNDFSRQRRVGCVRFNSPITFIGGNNGTKNDRATPRHQFHNTLFFVVVQAAHAYPHTNKRISTIHIHVCERPTMSAVYISCIALRCYLVGFRHSRVFCWSSRHMPRTFVDRIVCFVVYAAQGCVPHVCLCDTNILENDALFASDSRIRHRLTFQLQSSQVFIVSPRPLGRACCVIRAYTRVGNRRTSHNPHSQQRPRQR